MLHEFVERGWIAVVCNYRLAPRYPWPAQMQDVTRTLAVAADPTAPRGLTHHWRLSTVPARTPDEHAVLLTQLLDLEGLDLKNAVTEIAICSGPAPLGSLTMIASPPVKATVPSSVKAKVPFS